MRLLAESSPSHSEAAGDSVSDGESGTHFGFQVATSVLLSGKLPFLPTNGRTDCLNDQPLSIPGLEVHNGSQLVNRTCDTIILSEPTGGDGSDGGNEIHIGI